jgi:hypothetical protein
MTLFYHGTTEELSELNAISIDHADTHNSVIYLTPNRAYALFYIRDREINWVTCGVREDGVIRYDERFPDQLKTIYQGVSGYIYSCEDNGSFIASETRDIWTCNQPITISGREFITDTYDEIMKYKKSGLVNVRRYETLPEEEKKDVFDMMANLIFKNDWVNSTSKKATFFRQHFPEAWEYVKSHPERRHGPARGPAADRRRVVRQVGGRILDLRLRARRSDGGAP